ncbi:MAG: TraR/DksA family transcriptional regulator [Ktedonobacteraceae bacterium]
MTIDLQKMKERLETKQQELQVQISELRKEAGVPAESSEPAEDYAELEEAASELTNRSQGQSIFANEVLLLTEVRAALKRIAEGSYGMCVRCGQPIAQKRLEALPWAAYCIKDEEWLEQERSFMI